MFGQHASAEFLRLGTIDIWGWVTLCCGYCLVHWRMFSSIPGLYPVNATSTPPLGQLKTSPDVAKCPLGDKIAPSWEPLPSGVVTYSCGRTKTFPVCCCSASLVIREMQTKATVRYHPTPIRMAVFKKKDNTKCWQGCRKTGSLIHSRWECKIVQPLWKTVWRFLF